MVAFRGKARLGLTKQSDAHFKVRVKEQGEGAYRGRAAKVQVCVHTSSAFYLLSDCQRAEKLVFVFLAVFLFTQMYHHETVR